MTRRSPGTLPKYASFTIGPVPDALNGRAIVVDSDGVICPRIQIDTRPDSWVHALRPELLTVLEDSYATVPRSLPGAVPSKVAISASGNRRTVRSTVMSKGVPE